MVKRRALRAAVMATLEEQRIDALAYPTLRRKPALIGEAQGGTNCQLSATTGLPAITMPAGFSSDGLPIGLELLGGAWEEARLLKYAFAWEQASKLRKAPFSTPPLVSGKAPAPFSMQMGASAGITAGSTAPPASYALKYSYDQTTGALQYDATTSGLAPSDRVLGLTLQRSEGDKPGPIIAHLLLPNQTSGSSTLILRGRNREDFVAGRMFVHFYTRSMPLGWQRQAIGPARR